MAVDNASITEVVLGGTRGGPDVKTLREDKWWKLPLVTVLGLSAFVVYATWAAVWGDSNFFYLPHNIISPFYSPCLAHACKAAGDTGSPVFDWWRLSPALIILVFPLGFRMTCYYYRKAYYRSFWRAPVACAVQDARPGYTGETRAPLIIQNIHRYFFYAGLVFNVLLTIDAVQGFIWPTLHHQLVHGQYVTQSGGFGMSVGSLVLCVNATLLWIYSLSCHACRHLCGGQIRSFSKHPIRHKLWKFVTPLNARHMTFAWCSLFFVAFTDLYVRLVASGTITDFKIF